MFAAIAVVALLTVQDPPPAADMDGAWSVDLATDPAQPYQGRERGISYELDELDSIFHCRVWLTFSVDGPGRPAA